MTPAAWAWIVSMLGAAAFFAAGSLFSLGRGAARARASERAARERVAEERELLRAAVAEGEREHRAALALAKERDQLRASYAAVERTAREANARAERASRDVAEVVEQLREKRQKQRPALADTEARGEALRGILDRETRGSHFAGAVIADGLGLVVASTGDYGEALAAYGAFLAGIGEKTRGALPLRELRQVIVQDEHDTTLTVRPIASVEEDLALVTLAAGPRVSAGSAIER